jgi:isoleucyl-tRNA synthetase
VKWRVVYLAGVGGLWNGYLSYLNQSGDDWCRWEMNTDDMTERLRRKERGWKTIKETTTQLHNTFVFHFNWFRCNEFVDDRSFQKQQHQQIQFAGSIKQRRRNALAHAKEDNNTACDVCLVSCEFATLIIWGS